MIYILDVSKPPFSFSADAYECRMVANSAKPVARPRYNKKSTQTVYSCKPVFSSAEYEVHVLSVYEVINTSPPSAGNATVKVIIRARPNRPIILVLGSYEPVNWILNLPTGIAKVILVSMWWTLKLTNHTGDWPKSQNITRNHVSLFLDSPAPRQIRASFLNANEYVTRWRLVEVLRYGCWERVSFSRSRKPNQKNFHGFNIEWMIFCNYLACDLPEILPNIRSTKPLAYWNEIRRYSSGLRKIILFYSTTFLRKAHLQRELWRVDMQPISCKTSREILKNPLWMIWFYQLGWSCELATVKRFVNLFTAADSPSS